ncbi:MAG: recombinase family protein, partial [Syntrophales bacterium]
MPFGYDVENRKLLINPKEAQIVQYMYRLYLELGCVPLLKQDLDRQNIRSKIRGEKGGCLFSRGIIYGILSNPIYIGQIRHKGTCHQGQHEAIIDQELWEKVQRLMASNSAEHKKRSPNLVAYPLMNKLFEVSGRRLVSAASNKYGRYYRYYISETLKSDTREASPNGWRLPAAEIEQAVAHAGLNILHDNVAVTAALRESGIAVQHIPSVLNAAEKIQPDTADLINRFAQRVEVRKDGICSPLSLAPLMTTQMNSSGVTIARDIPMLMKRRGI